MTASTAVFAILFSLLLGAMIPGPSFVIVARNSIGISRADGLATALGMGVGGIFFGGIALAGLYTLLVAVEWLYIALKVAGGLYLIYIASKIWRGAAQPCRCRRKTTRHAHDERAQIVLARPHDATEQSQDRHLVRQHLRGASAATSSAMVLLRAAADGLRDRDGLVHHRRSGFLQQTSARDVSAREEVDRPHRGERDRDARSAPHTHGGQNRSVITSACKRHKAKDKRPGAPRGTSGLPLSRSEAPASQRMQLAVEIHRPL